MMSFRLSQVSGLYVSIGITQKLMLPFHAVIFATFDSSPRRNIGLDVAVFYGFSCVFRAFISLFTSSPHYTALCVRF